MKPFRKVVSIARHERMTRVVKVGSGAFVTVRNVAAIGAAVASLATGGFFVTRDRVPDAAPIATPAPLKGRLAYEASFSQDLGTPPPLASGARATAAVKPRPDGVDFSTGAYAPLLIRRAIPAKYVAELDLVT